ncbi:MAG: exonuclease domain-containing protein [Candidatus Altimarinota bacterium]
MNTPLFLDTETTDLDEGARVAEVAYKIPKTGEKDSQLFKPPVPISLLAMAVHHITEEMVADKPSFVGSQFRERLIALLPEHILVAHWAPFEMRIMKNEGVEVCQWIDTLRVARHLIDSEYYHLQYLRYFLKLKIEAVAHRAEGDVEVLEKLFEVLKRLTREKFETDDEENTLKKMMELSQTPVILKQVPFGRHKGKPFEQVVEEDRVALEQIRAEELAKPAHSQREDLVHTLDHWLPSA